MPDFLLSIITGVISGVAASWMFWRFQFEKAPTLELSDLIAQSTDENGDICYRFKIVNKGKHQVTNLYFRAWLCELKNIPGGQISSSLQELPVQNSPTVTLAPYGANERPWGLTPETTIKSTPRIDLKGELKDSSIRVLVTLKATDAVSGSTVVLQKTYQKQDIATGSFVIGESVKIENSQT